VFKSDTLDPHERPFPGMRERHLGSACGLGGCFRSRCLVSFLLPLSLGHCQWFRHGCAADHQKTYYGGYLRGCPSDYR
jgi:hypothetical protein